MAVTLGSAYGKIEIDASAVANSVKSAVAAINSMQGAGDTLGRTAASLGSSLDNVAQNAKTVGASLQPVAIALGAVSAASGALVVSSAKTAARTEELGFVLQAITKNAHAAAMANGDLAKAEQYTEQSTLATVEAVKKKGITTQVALGLTAQFARYNLDLAKSTDLARVSQDAAVLSMENSSENLDGLMYGIITYNQRILRTHGINVDLSKAFDAFAASVGKTTDELTEAEKVDATLNAVLSEGKRITGAYEAAMDSAGKRLRSLDRYWEEARNNLGKALLPAMGQLVDTATNLLKAFNNLSPTQQQFTAQSLAITAAVTGATGGFILLAPRIIETANAMVKFVSLGQEAVRGLQLMRAGIRAAEVASTGFAGSVAVAIPVVAALAATVVAAAKAYEFYQQVQKQTADVGAAWSAEIQKQVEAGKSAEDIMTEYAATQQRVNDVLNATPFYLKPFIDQQKVLNIAADEYVKTLATTDISQERYEAEVRKVAASMGLEIDATGNLVKVTRTYGGVVSTEVVKANYVLTDSARELSRWIQVTSKDISEARFVHRDLTTEVAKSTEQLKADTKAWEAEADALEAEADATRKGILSETQLQAVLSKRVAIEQDIITFQKKKSESDEEAAARLDGLKAKYIDLTTKIAEQADKSRDALAQEADAALNVAVKFKDSNDKLTERVELQKKLADLDKEIVKQGPAHLALIKKRTMSEKELQKTQGALLYLGQELGTIHRKQGESNAELAARTDALRKKYDEYKKIVGEVTGEIGAHIGMVGGATKAQQDERQAILDKITAIDQEMRTEMARQAVESLTPAMFGTGAEAAAKYEEAKRRLMLATGLMTEEALAEQDAIRLLTGALTTGRITPEEYALALGDVKRAASDGTVSLNELLIGVANFGGIDPTHFVPNLGVAVKTGIMAPLNQAGVDAAMAGAGISGGLARGVTDNSTAFATALSSVADTGIASLRVKLKMESPSLVFAELGTSMMQGLSQGVSDGARMLTDALTAAVNVSMTPLTLSMMQVTVASTPLVLALGSIASKARYDLSPALAGRSGVIISLNTVARAARTSMESIGKPLSDTFIAIAQAAQYAAAMVQAVASALDDVRKLKGALNLPVPGGGTTGGTTGPTGGTGGPNVPQQRAGAMAASITIPITIEKVSSNLDIEALAFRVLDIIRRRS